jgi:C1A family cysteine protease
MTTERKYLKKIGRVEPNDLKIKEFTPLIIPSAVDLRPGMPPVYDQSSIGSCTGQGIGAAYEYIDHNYFMPSRLFLYYNERVMEGTVNEDAGAQISDGIKSTEVSGICPEHMWPYDITKFAVKPPAPCYVDAQMHRTVTAHNIAQNLASIQASLASNVPVVIGIEVFESFETQQVANTGIVPMPQPNEQLLGGHCVLLVGYNNASQRFIVRNSWGTGWGAGGYFYIPYAYILNPNLTSDLWCILKDT